MPLSQLPKIVAIVGPTASGKSEIALDVARKFDGEIIIADSRQIYRDMKIGTNAPSDAETKEICHHLLGYWDPAKKFTVSDYKAAAEKAIFDIVSRGKLPILVGGTGLYIRAVINNFDFAKTQPNKALRKKLETLPISELVTRLKRVNPTLAERTDVNNKRRVVRALEIAETDSGAKNHTEPAKFEALQIARTVDRKKLYDAINKRVVAMIENGLENEVRELSKKLPWANEALTGIGYKEWRPYFEGQVDLATVTEEIQKNTRRYAKRQLTWFRADKRITWVTSSNEALELSKRFLQP